MFVPTRINPRLNPLEGLTPRQIEACAMRFGEKPTPSWRLIGTRLGIKSRSAASRLTARGLAHIRANGYEPATSSRQAA